MKTITLCGSLNYQKEMMAFAEKLALEGNCVLTPIYPTTNKNDRTKDQLEMLKAAHFKKIDISDAIAVVNVNNYIGESTKMEIAYAKEAGKEIIYYTEKG
jgi:hypothetical protein